MTLAEKETPIAVLLVEDHPGDALLLEETLSQGHCGLGAAPTSTNTGYQVRRAGSLAEALRAIDDGRPIAVILLDLMLPDSQGLATVRRMQQATRPKDVPIIVLTGLDDETLGLESLREGAQDYLVKGRLDHPLLSRSIAYAIERKRVDRLRQESFLHVERLLGELRKSHEELEHRVQGRTADLARTVEVLEEEVRARRQAEDELRTSQERLRTVLASAPIILWSLDPRGNVTLMEGSLAKSLQLTSPASSGGNGDPAATKAGQAAWNRMREGNPRLSWLIRRATAGRDARTILEFAGRSLDTRYSALRDAEGRTLGLIGVSMDVTEHVQAQEHIQRANRALRVLGESSQALGRATDEKGLLRQTCRNVVHVGGYRLAWVSWKPDAPDTPAACVQAGLPPNLAKGHPWLAAEQTGPSARALQTGQAVIAHDLPNHGGYVEWHPEAARLGVTSVLALPLTLDNQVMGVLTIGSADSEAFDPQEVELLGDLANDIAFGLTALRARRQASDAQQDLLRQAQVMDAFFEHTATPLAFLDRNLKFLEVNQAYARTFSMDSGQLRGQCLPDFLPPPLRAAVRRGAREKKTVIEQARPLSFDQHPEWGTTFWDMALVPILNASGQLDSLVYSLQDVTKRHRHEERMRATNMLLELFALRGTRKDYLDGVADLLHRWADCECVGIRLVDKGRRIPYEAALGFSASFLKKEGPLSLEAGSCICIRVMTGQPDPAERPFLTPRGSFVCNHLEAMTRTLTPRQRSNFRGACIESGFASVAIIPVRYRDQTLGALHLADRKAKKIGSRELEFLEVISPLIGEALHRFEIEQALKLSEEHFRLMVESSQDFIARLGLDGRYLSLNQAGSELLGLARPEDQVGHKASEGIVENAEGFDLALALAGGGQTAGVQYTSRGSGGQEVWWDAKLTPVRNAENEVVGVLLVSRDVTQRRRLEREVMAVGAQERWRIGHDLHESLGQHLTGITFLCKSLQQRLQGRNLPEAAEAGELSTLVNKAINQTRTLARSLSPVEPKAEGLIAALRELTEGIARGHRVSCVFRYDRSLAFDDNYKAMQLYLIAQEALNDAVRRAKAKRITVTLSRRRDQVHLVIEDNGAAGREAQPGPNLQMIQYRAGLIGGAMKVAKCGRKGRRITCVVSVPPASKPQTT